MKTRVAGRSHRGRLVKQATVMSNAKRVVSPTSDPYCIEIPDSFSLGFYQIFRAYSRRPFPMIPISWRVPRTTASDLQ